MAACGPTNLRLGDLPAGEAGETGSGGGSGNLGGSGGSGGIDLTGGECDPLAPRTEAIELQASDIVQAGRDSDGTVYVLTEGGGGLRLFVGSDQALSEEFEKGTGEGPEGSGKFWTFGYEDAQGVDATVEVQEDASGSRRMGVAKGALLGKGFDVGATGTVLTPIAAAVAAATPATSLHTFHVEFSGTSPKRNVLLTGPDHAGSFEQFRLFIGPLSAMAEVPIKSVSRGLSIPTTTIVSFRFPDGSGAAADSTLTYRSDSEDAELQVGTDDGSALLGADMVVPKGATFLCRKDER